MSRASFIYVASLAAHGLLAVGVVSIKGARAKEQVSIQVIERAKPPKAKVEPDKPPPKAEEKAKAAPKPALAKAVDAPPPAPGAQGGDATPDFGLALGGGGDGAGVAVRAPSSAPSVAAPEVAPVRKVLSAPSPQETCSEPAVKPKVLSIAQPSYTADARAAEVQGKVRVELSVDATGRVTQAKVLEGLGHGLDEAALAAARAATFEPGTRCGKPAAATFVIAMRFSL